MSDYKFFQLCLLLKAYLPSFVNESFAEYSILGGQHFFLGGLAPCLSISPITFRVSEEKALLCSNDDSKKKSV